MKRLLAASAFIFTFVFAGSSWAQEHGHFGMHIDYLRLGATDSNFVGLGGRLSLKPSRYFGLEGELNYDFEQGLTEGFTNPASGIVTLTRAHLRILHGMFGPTFETGHGAFRLFVTAKGGFMNFRFSDRPVTVGNFFSSVEMLRTNDVSAVFYPGGGAEAHLGPIGIRFDIGDEMYFADGAHHNLRMSLGPIIRF
jgi:hypothetical protein